MINKKQFWIALAIALVFFKACPLLAQVSQPLVVPTSGYTIPYEGSLANADGSPVSGTVTIAFSIYPQPFTGNPVWSETHSNVQVINGIFDVILGNINSMSLEIFDYAHLYLGFSVNNGPEISPRTVFLASPLHTQVTATASPSNYSLLSDISGSVSSKNFIGVLPVDKGGTGVTSVDEIKTLLGLEAILSRQARSVAPDASAISTVGYTDRSASTGIWTANVAFGEPALSDSAAETNSNGATLDFAIPGTAQNAQLSFNAANTGGYISVWLFIRGDWRFHRRIDTRQTLNNTSRNGNIIVFAASGFISASGVDNATAIRIQNETGTFRFTGLQFGTELLGGQDNGYTNWNALYSHPFRVTQNRVLVDTDSSTVFGASKLGVKGNMAVGSTFGTLVAPTNGLLVEGAVQIGTTLSSVYALNVSGNTKVKGLGIGTDLTSGLALAVNGDTDFTSHKLNNVTRIGLNGYSFDTLATPGKWVVTSNASAPELSLFGAGFIQSKAATAATQNLTIGFRHAEESNAFGINLNNTAAVINVNGTPLWRVSPTGVMQFNPATTEAFSSVVKYDFAVQDFPVPNTLSTVIFRTRKQESRPSLIHSGTNGDWDILSSGILGSIKMQATGGDVLIGSLSVPSKLMVNSVSSFNANVHFQGNVFIGSINVGQALAGGGSGGGNSNQVTFTNGAILKAVTPNSEIVRLSWDDNNAEGGFKVIHTKTPQNGSWIAQERTFGSISASGADNLQFGLKDGAGNWSFRTAPNYTYVNNLNQTVTLPAETKLFVGGTEKISLTPSLTTFLGSTQWVDANNPLTNSSYIMRILSGGELEVAGTSPAGKSNLFIVNSLRISGQTIDFSNITSNPSRGISFDGNSALTSTGVSELLLNRKYSFAIVTVGSIASYNNVLENPRFRVLGNMSARKYFDILSDGSLDDLHVVDPSAQSIITDIRGRNLFFTAVTANVLFANVGKVPTLSVQKIFDIADPYYVLDPSNISIMNKVTSFRFVDLSDQTYWAKPSDVSRFKKLVIKDNTAGAYGQEYGNWQLQVIANSGFSGAIRAINQSSPSATGNRIAAIYAWNQGPTVQGLAPADFMSQNGTYLSVSSKRWKRDIRPYPDALNTILKLTGVMYTNINNPQPVKNDIGFIAEDIGQVIPGVVAWENDKDAIGVYYDKVIPILVEAFKEEHAQVTTLKTQVSKLESEMAELKKVVEGLKKK